MTDCGGTVNWQGVCSCEREKCDACGTTYHTDADQLRYCSAWGQICADNSDCQYRCDSDCCGGGSRYDTREEERGR